MNFSRACEMVERYCDASTDPELSFADIHGLLNDHAAVPDASNRAPADEGWTQTYSTRGVFAAIAEGWTLKAGRCAGRFDFTTDGQQFRRSQMVDHCEAQAARYRRKANRSAPVS